MKNDYMRLILVILGAIIIGYLIYSYNNTSKESFENFSDVENKMTYPTTAPPSAGVGEDAYLSNPFAGQNQLLQNNLNPNVSTVNNTNVLEPSGNIPCNAPKASEPVGENEVFTSVSDFPESAGPTGNCGNQYPKDCFPKDQLSPQELLPGDANSTWAQVVPAGQGDLGDQNFLNAGFHVGVNTVGQTLRNANLQLRSEPPNPQVKVSPWLQSTIEPDTNRKPLEIGGCE